MKLILFEMIIALIQLTAAVSPSYAVRRSNTEAPTGITKWSIVLSVPASNNKPGETLVKYYPTSATFKLPPSPYLKAFGLECSLLEEKSGTRDFRCRISERSERDMEVSCQGPNHSIDVTYKNKASALRIQVFCDDITK